MVPPRFVFAVRLEAVRVELECALVEGEPSPELAVRDVDAVHDRMDVDDWDGAAAAALRLAEVSLAAVGVSGRDPILAGIGRDAGLPQRSLTARDLLGTMVDACPSLEEPVDRQLIERGAVLVSREHVPRLLSMVRDRPELSGLVEMLEDAAGRSCDVIELDHRSAPAATQTTDRREDDEGDLYDGGHVDDVADRARSRSMFEDLHVEGARVFGRREGRGLLAATPFGPVTCRDDGVARVAVPARIDDSTGWVIDFVEVEAMVTGVSWSRDGEIMLATPEGIALVRGHDPVEWIREPARWAARFAEVVVALRGDRGWWELRDGGWSPIPLPSAGGAPPAVARTGDHDGEDVLLWAGAGWRYVRGEWQRGFALGLDSGHGGTVVSDGVSRDFYALVSGKLARVRDGVATIVLACAGRAITPGPDGAVIVREDPGEDPGREERSDADGRLGWIYLPSTDRAVELRSEHCGVIAARGLAYSPSDRALIAYARPLLDEPECTWLAWRAAIGEFMTPAFAITELGDRLRIPWSALGWPSDLPEPTRVAACWMSDDDLAHAVGGSVTIGADFELSGDDPYLPVAGGIFDEDVFGPLKRTPDGRRALPDLNATPVMARPQSRRFGVVELPEAVESPWTRVVPSDPAIAARMRNRRVPVMPGALRAHVVDEGGERTSSLTRHYLRIANVAARWRRLVELNAPAVIVVHERAAFVAALAGGWLDGAVIDGLDTPPLLRWLDMVQYGTHGWAQLIQELDDTLAASPNELRAHVGDIAGPAVKTVLLALGVELVPLAPDGTIARARLDDVRHARHYFHASDAHGYQLAGRWLAKYEFPATADVPWITIDVAGEPSGPMRMLTVGASARPWPGTRMHAEVACLLSAGISDDERTAIARMLAMVAAYPHRTGRRLGHHHTIAFDAPFATFAGVLLLVDDLDLYRLAPLLPYRPHVLLAIGLGRAQMERAGTLEANATLAEELERHGNLTVPRR
jgi:hypothetical protein